MFKILTDIGSVRNNPLPFGERMLEGLKTTFLGMGVVFAILILLWLLLELFGKIFGKKQNVKSAPAEEETESVAISDTITESVTDEESENEEEIAAAITAAITAYLMSESGEAPAKGFKVVSFKKATTKQAWNRK